MEEKNKMTIEEKLKNLNIDFIEVEHPAVYTVEEAKEKLPNMEGIGCKNLFLKTKKKELFLYTLPEDKKVDLNSLAGKLNVKNFHFASKETLKEVLDLIPGSVTPLAIMNDKDNQVTVLLDKELKDKKVQVHPNKNTATIILSYHDLIKYIESENHKIIEI